MFREITEMDVASLYPNREMVKGFYKQKENNMVKDFIVVHDDSEDGAVMIIRKSAIVAVTNEKFGGETYCNIRTENTVFRVTETYAEVVKRIFE